MSSGPGTYALQVFDEAALLQLCRDVGLGSKRCQFFVARWTHRTGWSRGNFREHFVSSEESYLICLPRVHPQDRYQHLMFRFGGFRCEVSRRWWSSEAIRLTPLNDAASARPEGFESALFQALEILHRDISPPGEVFVVPRIEWNDAGSLIGFQEEAPPLTFSAAPFDQRAYERLCRDIGYDRKRIGYLRRSWERGRFWKEYLVAGDDAYLVHVPPVDVMDLHRYYLFCFRGVCCEVSRRHEFSDAIAVSRIGDRHAELPTGYASALCMAIAASHRETGASLREIVVQTIQWHHGPLNGRWRRSPGDAAETLVARPRHDKVRPARAKRRARMNRPLADGFQVSAALLIIGFIVFLFWITHF